MAKAAAGVCESLAVLQCLPSTTAAVNWRSHWAAHAASLTLACYVYQKENQCFSFLHLLLCFFLSFLSFEKFSLV